MEIEKVTFYKAGVAYNRSSESYPTTSVIKISLPRVKCLEADGPYRPSWAIDYTPPENRPVSVLRREPRGQNIGREKKFTPMTEFEKKVGELVTQGFSFDYIVNETGKTKSSVVSTYHRYKRKISLMQIENSVIVI